MRHRTTIIAGVTLALTLAGCASGGQETTSAPSETETTGTTPERTPASSGTTPERSPASGGPDAASEDATVTIEDFEYLPPRLEIAVGTTVTWRNDDPFAHTVTSGTPDAPTDLFDEELGELDSAANAGTSFSYTFEEAGEVAYFCRFHPNMTATVVVTEG